MSWRGAGTQTSAFLPVVAQVSGLAWFVLWLWGHDEAAVYPMVIAFIAFITGGTTLGLSRGPTGGTRVVTQDMVRRSGPPGSVPPPYSPRYRQPVHRVHAPVPP